MKKAVISDLDGTISDRRHRLHYLEGKKDWESFFESLIDDPPIVRTIEQIEELIDEGAELVLVTGRPEQYRKSSEEWIKNNTPFDKYQLYMRKDKDFRKDIVIKKEMLDQIRENYELEIIFEDQENIAKMWEDNDLKCILVE